MFTFGRPCVHKILAKSNRLCQSHSFRSEIISLPRENISNVALQLSNKFLSMIVQYSDCFRESKPCLSRQHRHPSTGVDGFEIQLDLTTCFIVYHYYGCRSLFGATLYNEEFSQTASNRSFPKLPETKNVLFRRTHL